MPDITVNNIQTILSTGNSYTPSDVDDAVLVVIVSNETNNFGETVSDIQFGGVALTQAVYETTGGGSWRNDGAIWYLVNPGTTAGNITYTSNDSEGLTVLTLANVDQTDPLGATVSAQTTSNVNSLSANITPEASNSILIAGYNTRESTTATPDSGQTEMSDFNVSSSSHCTSYELRANTDQVSQGFSTAANQARTVLTVAEFKNATGATNTDVPLTGVAGTGAIGTVTIITDMTATLPAVSGTGEVGDISTQSDTTNTLPGVVSSGLAGDIDVSTVDVTYVTPTGVEGTGEVGNLAVITDAAIVINGVSGTGEAGTLTVSTEENQTTILTGVEGVGGVGTVIAFSDAILTLTGVQAQSATGDVAVVSSSTATLTGVVGTGAVGTLTVDQDALVALIGVEAVGQLGTLLPSEDEEATLLGVAGVGQVGEIIIKLTGSWAAQREEDGSWSIQSQDSQTWVDQVRNNQNWTDPN